MSTEIPTVQARLDETHDGAWADCPHCGWENGVSWAKTKECNGCGKTFKVAPGPLVQDPPQPDIRIFRGSGDTLFYDMGDISAP